MGFASGVDARSLLRVAQASITRALGLQEVHRPHDVVPASDAERDGQTRLGAITRLKIGEQSWGGTTQRAAARMAVMK